MYQLPTAVETELKVSLCHCVERVQGLPITVADIN